VVALYAELDEKAEQLQRANELKTRFLSNMGHEFRTPVNSILALPRLLLGRSDGELTAEQEKQLSFIQQASLTTTKRHATCSDGSDGDSLRGYRSR
jgi:signal transduction histidine kinase